MKLSAAEEAEFARLLAALATLEQESGGLPGVQTSSTREALLMRVIESQRRDRYVALLEQRTSSASFLVDRETFDPPRALITARNRRKFDEACWLNFLMTHFAQHRAFRWTALREVYFGNEGDRWTWTEVCSDPDRFRDWLENSAVALKSAGVRFGNHRKYESLSGWSPAGTGSVVSSYVDWIGPNHSHSERFSRFSEGMTTERFDAIYRSMDAVHRFGRLAKFDYLMGLNRYRLLDVAPGHAYLVGATGPQMGAQLLFGAHLSPKALHDRAVDFGRSLDIGYDIVEDAICNWQKSPSKFMPFRG